MLLLALGIACLAPRSPPTPAPGTSRSALSQCTVTLCLDYNMLTVTTAAAACVSHETREYLHLKVDQLHIIIWKSKDTPFKPELVAKEA